MCNCKWHVREKFCGHSKTSVDAKSVLRFYVGGSMRLILETQGIKRLYGRFGENLVSPTDIVVAWLRLIYREISPVLPRGIQLEDVRICARARAES